MSGKFCDAAYFSLQFFGVGFVPLNLVNILVINVSDSISVSAVVRCCWLSTSRRASILQ